MPSLQHTDYLIIFALDNEPIITSPTLLSSLSPSSHPPLSGDGDKEHALLGHGVRQERGNLW